MKTIDQIMAKDLEAVKKNPLALKDVKHQTPEICKVAVEQNGLALKFVKNQTPEICRTAVAQTGHAMFYIKKKQTGVKNETRRSEP
jgi:hypothetical protein